MTKKKKIPIISHHASKESAYWERRCARCGSEIEWISCEKCDGTGYDNEDVNLYCILCGGYGGLYKCLNEEVKCLQNPLFGRENIQRGQFEFYENNKEEKNDDKKDYSVKNK